MFDETNQPTIASVRSGTRATPSRALEPLGSLGRFESAGRETHGAPSARACEGGRETFCPKGDSTTFSFVHAGWQMADGRRFGRALKKQSGSANEGRIVAFASDVA